MRSSLARHSRRNEYRMDEKLERSNNTATLPRYYAISRKKGNYLENLTSILILIFYHGAFLFYLTRVSLDFTPGKENKERRDELFVARLTSFCSVSIVLSVRTPRSETTFRFVLCSRLRKLICRNWRSPKNVSFALPLILSNEETNETNWSENWKHRIVKFLNRL